MSSLGRIAAALFLLVAGWFLSQHGGHYVYEVWAYAVLFFAVVPLMAGLGARPDGEDFSARGLSTLLAIAQLLFLYWIHKRFGLLYSIGPKSGADPWFKFAVRASLAISAVLLALRLRPSAPAEKLYATLAAITGSLMLLAHALVPALSPQPFIDVWVNNTAGVDFLLHGLNPFAQSYVDIYQGAYAYKPGFLYFPGLLYVLAPFRALFGDIRYAFVACQVAMSVALYAIARRSWGSASPLRFQLPLLWLSFPVTFLVLEQAWTDTILATLFVLIAWLVESRRFRAAGAAMGFVFSVKQYAFVFPLMALIRVFRRAGWEKALTVAAWGALVFGVVVIPFVLADPAAFYSMTIQSQAGQGIRTDSFNVTSFLAQQQGYEMPGAIQALAAIIGIGGGAYFVAREPRLRPEAVAAASFFGFGCSFLFGKWAFCNYHYLLAACLVLYLASRNPEGALE